MAKAKRTCHYCGREVGVTEWSCPACGKALVARLHMRNEPVEKRRQSGGPLGLIVVGALLAVFAYLAYHSWILPNTMVEVMAGEVVICRDTGEKRINYKERKMVRRKNADLPRNSMREIYIDCDTGDRTAEAPAAEQNRQPDSEAEAGRRPAARSQSDLAAAAEISGERHPAAVANLPYEPLELNMTTEAVVSAWGEPLKVEYMVRGTTEIERWYYGDPLYSLLIFERYVDFKNGRVAGFHTDRELNNLYEQVMAERRQGSF